MKRLLSGILAIVMVFTLIPFFELKSSAALASLQNVQLDGDVISWDSFPGATYYQVSVGTGGGFITGTSRNLWDACASYREKSGSKKVTIIAYNGLPSDGGQPVSAKYETTYNYTSLGTLAAPTNLAWSGTFGATWNAVSNADEYSVFLYRLSSNGGSTPVRKFVVKSNSIDFTTEKGTYTAPYIAPVPGEQYKVEVSALSTSGYSPSTKVSTDFTLLVPGTISSITGFSLNGNVLSWDAYPNASYYTVSFGNSSYTVETNSINLKTAMDTQSMAEGSYKISVVAYNALPSNGGQSISLLTEYENSYNYTNNGKLSSPTNLRFDGFTIRWDAVANANSYYVTVYRMSDSSKILQTLSTSNYINLSNRFGEPVPGESYMFYVSARSGSGYSPSDEVSSAWKMFNARYDVNVTTPSHGTATVDKSRAEAGETIKVTATPDSGYYVAGIYVNGAIIPENTFTMPSKDTTVSVAFAELGTIDTINVTIATPRDGEAPVSTVTIPSGAKYTATVTSCTPNSGVEEVVSFVGGTEYVYTIDVRAKTGFSFSNSTEVYVNGEKITMGGTSTGRSIKYHCVASLPLLTGTVNVTGDLIYDSTLTATLTDSNTSGLKNYTWKSGDDIIVNASTDPSITLNKSSYIGKPITVIIKDMNHSGEVSYTTGVVGKLSTTAPTGLTVTKPSDKGLSDGSIDGTTEYMEYSTTTSFSTAYDCDHPSTTGLPAGTYYVRYKETSTENASPYVTVSISESDGVIKTVNINLDRFIMGEVHDPTLTSSDPALYSAEYYNTSTYPIPFNNVAPSSSGLGFDDVRLNITAASGYKFDEDVTVFTINGQTPSYCNVDSDSTAQIYIRMYVEKVDLTGTATIADSPACDDYINVNFTGNNSGTLSYKWYRDGEYIDNNTKHRVTADDIGHSIYVVVTDSEHTGSVQSNTVIPVKAPSSDSAPDASVHKNPSYQGASNGSILCSSAYWGSIEISTDGVNWEGVPSGSSYIENLSADTYYLRYKGSDEHLPSEMTTVVVPDGQPLISQAICSVVEPIVGEFPNNTVTTSGTTYTVSMYNNVNYGSRFIANESFKYQVRFSPNSGYVFDKDATEFYANGKLATSVETHGDDIVASFYFDSTMLPLTGVANITGTPRPNNTLKASLDGGNHIGTISYKWYIDGVEVSTNNKLDVTEEHLGCEITLEITDSKRSGSLISDSVVITTLGLISEETPEATFSAITKQLSNVSSGMKYRIGSGDWVDIDSTTVDLSSAVTGACTIYVVKKGNYTTTCNSASCIINVAKASKPTSITSTACTTSSNNDGTISGVDTTMEYKLSTAANWTKCTGTSITGLANGTYYVRYSATATSLESDAFEIAVAAHTHTYNCKVATEANQKIKVSCMYPATYYYTCTCGEKGTETFTVGTTLEHIWGSWEPYNATHHKRSCSNGFTHYEQAPHTFDGGVVTLDPTCLAKGTKKFTCTACGYEKYEDVAVVDHKYVDGECIWCHIEEKSALFETSDYVRVAGSNRYATSTVVADANAKVVGVTKYDAIIVVTGKDFADALSATYLSSLLGAPIISTKPEGMDDTTVYITTHLKNGGKVYVVGGENAISASYFTSLSDSLKFIPGTSIERLAGKNRYKTNAIVLEKAYEIEQDKGLACPEYAFICTGTGYADALSASAVGAPIILVKPETGLCDEQKAYLEKRQNDSKAFDMLYVIGGDKAVSEANANAAKAYTNDKSFTRLGGANRYATSKLVADTFFAKATGTNAIVLAYAKNYPDALAGGLLAYSLNAPLILTMDDNYTAANEYVTSMDGQIEYAVVLGGSGLVSDTTVNTIMGTIGIVVKNFE